MVDRLAHAKNADISNNEELKNYLQGLRTDFYDLYTEIMWTADVLQARLSNIKGIKNNVRARLIAGALKKVAEACKIAGSGSTAVWTMFEQRFSAELANSRQSKRKTKDTFKIIN